MLPQAHSCRECCSFVTGGCVEMNTGGTQFYYHPKCFNCKKCGGPLRQGQADQHGEQPYCTKCILIVNPKHSVRAVTRDMGFKFT